jgi:phosphatidylglycerophosphate synthase
VLFTLGVPLILYSAIPDYYQNFNVQAQLQQQLQPPPVIGVKITSPTTGQQVPVGQLTISGTSTDNATSDCTVYADWNNTKPFQTATATGPGGVNDYSRWTFTYTDNYHLITNGTNNLTSKLSCLDESNLGSTANLTKSYSVNVTGVATTGAVSATKENEKNNTDATTTITTPPEEPTIYWDLDDIEEEDIDRDNKQVFELEDNIFGSARLSEVFQCGYNLGLNNSSLTREQISKYCNNLILETENVDDMTIFGFGPIFIIVGLIIIGIGSAIWLIVRRRKGRKARTESLSGVSMEMMTRNREEEEEHHRFTTKKVLTCSIILGLISALLSIFIDWLHVLSMAAFVFASITVWYMFGEKLHRWKETREKKREINIGYKSKYN